MSRPTPGQTYTVRPGDTLRNVARAAYGNDQGARIAKANETLLSGRDVSREGLPTLFPGDVLNIPDTDRYDGRTVTALLRDPAVPARRPYAFSADEADADSIEDAVRWRMAKSVADATTIDVQIAGYRNEQQGGDLWQENRKVTLWAPPVMIFQETEMIIRSVRLIKDESGGDTTVLSLAFPEAYNLENRTAYPWDGYFAEAQR